MLYFTLCKQTKKNDSQELHCKLNHNKGSFHLDDFLDFFQSHFFFLILFWNLGFKICMVVFSFTFYFAVCIGNFFCSLCCSCFCTLLSVWCYRHSVRNNHPFLKCLFGQLKKTAPTSLVYTV